MKALIASCARLFKTSDGLIYTPVVYGYEFYQRYLNVFDEVIVAGFCETVSDAEAEGMIRVSGAKLSVFELPYPQGEWDYIRKRFDIIKTISKAMPPCDLMILRVPDTLCFLLMERAIRDKTVFGVEVTSDPLNLYTRKTSKSKYYFVYKYWYYLKLRRACIYATGTSYVTQSQLQEHYPPNPGGGRFTTNYTNANVIVPDDMSARILPHTRRFRFIHVSVSIAGSKKGHREAVMTILQLKKEGYDAELAFVGSGELDPAIREIIKSNQLEDSIMLLGRLTPGEVIDELDKADALLFPSYNEGLPRVVIEAMSRALPVVASDIPAHRELLEADYLAPVENFKGLSECARRLMTDGNEYERVSRRNLDHARKNYDIRVIEKKRDEFYQRLRQAAQSRAAIRRGNAQS